MEFLALNEVWAWCAAHGFGLTPDSRLEVPATATHRTRTLYAEGRRSGRESEVAASCVQALGHWDECLLWVTGWGVWPSGEDWPAYYAARGERGERRSLEEAPGHLFGAGEGAELHSFLVMVLENAWDAIVLPAFGEAKGEVLAKVSHDEYVDVYALASDTSGGSTISSSPACRLHPVE